MTVAILAYVGLQLLIGAWVARRIRTEDDYLVAGRRLGYGLTTFTIFATWFGAETCIGAAGAIYERGLAGGSADPFGYGACLLLLGLVFAAPLWRRRLTTLADLFGQRYGPAVERFAVLLLVPTSLLWAAAQVRAFGSVLAAVSGMETALTITIAAAIVVVYTISGGLLADAWTDLLQGAVLLAGLALLFAFVVADVGAAPFAAIPAARLQPFGGGSPLAVLEEWAIPVCGSVVAAELVARVVAARSPEVARRSALGASGIYLAGGLLPVALGLVGPSLLPDLADPEGLLPLLAARYLPGVLYVVFAGALVSAILSTVDSALLVAASLVSHNVVVPLRPGMSEAGRVRAARVGVAVFGVLAYVLALHADGVYALVEEASAFGSAGVVTVVTFGLFTHTGGPGSAFASLAAGVVTWIAGAYVLALPYPYLTSLAAAVLTYGAVALAERRLAVPAEAAGRTG